MGNLESGRLAFERAPFALCCKGAEYSCGLFVITAMKKPLAMRR